MIHFKTPNSSHYFDLQHKLTSMMMMSSSTPASTITLPSSSVTMALVAAIAGIALVLRAVKRSLSPTICASLSCRCGTVQGKVCAKREDTMRIHCFCEDCRTYAKVIANLDDNKKTNNNNNKPMLYSSGETHIVHVCKNAVTITKGMEHIKLARKSTKMPGMFRYYADCCHVPLMNTIKFLGFVGIIEDNLEVSEREKFYGPVGYCTKEAVKFPVEDIVPDMNIPLCYWNFFRFIPWTKAGPFDYTMTPTIFWGEEGGGEGEERKSEHNNKKQN